MKLSSVVSSPRPPTPHRLFRSLLLALASLPAGAVLAGDLDDQAAEVGAADPIEAWRLINGSQLTVNGGQTQHIRAGDTSVVNLQNARVVRTGLEREAIHLYGEATLVANSSRIDGSVFIDSGNTSVTLKDSIVVVDAAQLVPGATSSIGIDASILSAWDSQFTPSVVLDGTYVRVDDLHSPPRPFTTGIGARLVVGQMDILNGSQVVAANVGALLMGERVDSGALRLDINDSTLQSGRGAAIQVIPRFASTYNITVANGSHLIAGDGNLLRVGRDGAVSGSFTDVNFTVDDARLSGDVRLDSLFATMGSLNVALRNKAQIDGRFINVTRAEIDGDSNWLMTGDSNVGRLSLGSTGTVALGNGSTFNTLTADSFTGNGGTLLFNTMLGDDSSLTDKLVINGDANGQANVRVLNASGAGAKTDKGIELIRVGGASNAQFDLQGRAVGGQYEYFLFKDASDGGWYLRSALAGAPDPCVVDPTLPECRPIDPVDPVNPIDPGPVLRPEAGAYLANQFAMDQLLRHGWRDRQGSISAVDGVRGWARVDATQSKLSAVEDQLDLRVDRSRLQLGADIGVFDNGQGRVGVMGTLAKSDATSRSQLTGYSARGKVNGGALGVYGNWSSDALYVDASVQRGQFRNRVQGEGLAEERYDSDIWQSSLEAGYRIGIGQIGSTALSLQPELQLVYIDANTDRHQETNGTVVRSLGGSGLSGRMGLRLQGEGRSAAGAAVSPYVVANWYRDGASNGMAFDDEALKASVPRNRYELNAGARVDFRSGLSAWGGFGVMRGDHGYREATANLSVAYTW
ncbi:autotransporter outer membrane beta-barrel domain-containing protein [Stenotrophomonas maltophilia]|uniref:autotransporter family protein n=1 Tax=Stenotrophomonas maltophilia TaxID=40324 RepID=UPI000C25E862|nr:autotransporter outer membrane beta-barrel domain-containing protein [Stenotrophomonas maltophilia]PJL57458.1 autotransporter outer membrane beta-barrel domain-containing protein [Stenotrophomonas maltophilia]